MQKLTTMLKVLWTNVPFVLVILGLACFVYAGFLFTQILGYILLGIGIILVAYIISPPIERK